MRCSVVARSSAAAAAGRRDDSQKLGMVLCTVKPNYQAARPADALARQLLLGVPVGRAFRKRGRGPAVAGGLGPRRIRGPPLGEPSRDDREAFGRPETPSIGFGAPRARTTHGAEPEEREGAVRVRRDPRRDAAPARRRRARARRPLLLQRAALRLGGGSCVHVSSRSGRRACGLRCGVVCERAGRTRVRFLLPPRGWRTRCAARAATGGRKPVGMQTCGYARLVLRHQARDAARLFFFWFLARCCAGSWGALGQACAAGRSCEARAAPRPARSLSDSLRCS